MRQKPCVNLKNRCNLCFVDFFMALYLEIFRFTHYFLSRLKKKSDFYVYSLQSKIHNKQYKFCETRHNRRLLSKTQVKLKSNLMNIQLNLF